MFVRTATLALAAATALAGFTGAASAQNRNITSNYGYVASHDTVSRDRFAEIESYPRVGRAASSTSKYDVAVPGSGANYVPRHETGSAANVTSNYGYDH